jgi:hypothetical protein
VQRATRQGRRRRNGVLAASFEEPLRLEQAAQDAFYRGDPEPFTALFYRREDGEWRLVHRRGDFAPTDQGPPS